MSASFIKVSPNRISHIQIRSDQISHSAVSNSLRSHESQHARPPWSSPTPGVHWDSRSSVLNLISLELARQWKWKWSHVQLFETPWTVAYQAPLSMGFSRKECWSGLPFPSPGDLPNPGIEPGLPHCRQTLYRLSHEGSPARQWLCLILFILLHLVLNSFNNFATQYLDLQLSFTLLQLLIPINSPPLHYYQHLQCL